MVKGKGHTCLSQTKCLAGLDDLDVDDDFDTDDVDLGGSWSHVWAGAESSAFVRGIL